LVTVDPDGEELEDRNKRGKRKNEQAFVKLNWRRAKRKEKDRKEGTKRSELKPTESGDERGGGVTESN